MKMLANVLVLWRNLVQLLYTLSTLLLEVCNLAALLLSGLPSAVLSRFSGMHGTSLGRCSEMTPDVSGCCRGRKGLYIPAHGRSASGWKGDSAGQRLKERSQEPCTQPQPSAGWWSLDFRHTKRVWQSWMCARREHGAFCEILDLSVPICKWEIGIGAQIHSGSAFPCFLCCYPVKLTELFLPGRKKQWDLSSVYSGSNLGHSHSISTERTRHCMECLQS